MRAGVLSLGLFLASAPLSAQTPTLTVTESLRADPRAATREAARRRDGVSRCLTRAASEDPERLAPLRRIVIIVHLSREGRAVTVELHPPLLTPGLSECLAEALLPWDQGGRPGLRALVRLRLDR